MLGTAPQPALPFYLGTSDHAPGGHLARAKMLSALASSSVELGKSLPGDASSPQTPADPHGISWEKQALGLGATLGWALVLKAAAEPGAAAGADRAELNGSEMGRRKPRPAPKARVPNPRGAKIRPNVLSGASLASISAVLAPLMQGQRCFLSFPTPILSITMSFKSAFRFIWVHLGKCSTSTCVVLRG